ncbi:hypothetical protein EDD18DRAFT_1357939 [Armillaria luteobubalina]|uniref:Uncharacterized protein n=1 Tax=Armillaria luteobubalina TaxID=153913 RepID=A0AA39PX94_9AGAR|nr:hypothetical protein EDD18DRAFT_1357939 [Armillaria luteobubalina]
MDILVNQLLGLPALSRSSYPDHMLAISFYLISCVRFGPAFSGMEVSSLIFFTYLLIGLQQPKTLGMMNTTYIAIHHPHCHETLVAALFALIEALTMFTLEMYMAAILWTTKRRLKAAGINDNIYAIFPLSLFCRSLTFVMYILIGIGLSAFIVTSLTGHSPVWKLILTTPPIVMALAFGTQKDMIAYYCCQKKGGCHEGMD